MIRSLRLLATLSLVASLAGCAGGWRGGSPPAEWAANAPAASAGAAPTKAGTASGTHATADGVVFVWKGEGKTVNVAGDFNAWSTSADALQKQTDGSWSLTKKLAAGKYAYKFVIDGGNWKPDPTVTEGVDDGFGGKNSLVEVGGTAAAAPVAKAAPTAAAAAGAGPAVTADGVTFKYSGPGNTVNVAGEFNAWSTSADALKKNADGSWSLTRALAPGRYAYKFVIDGGTWKEDPNAAEFVDDGYGGKNSVVVVGGGGGGGGAAAPSAAAPAKAASAVKPLAAGAKPRAPQAGAAGVTFTYAGPATSGVALCGDFNGWATTADPMTQAADGTWTVTKKLAAGSYAYKFLVDGSNWKTDDGNTQTQDDGFGGKNSVVVVK